LTEPGGAIAGKALIHGRHSASSGTGMFPAAGWMPTPTKGSSAMLYYAIVFLVIAIIAAVLGFGGIAGAASGIAQILFFVFLVLFVLSLIFGRRPRI
jgi:uncharacterized membrane protein YtjA (UPF0391 family)